MGVAGSALAPAAIITRTFMGLCPLVITGEQVERRQAQWRGGCRRPDDSQRSVAWFVLVVTTRTMRLSRLAATLRRTTLPLMTMMEIVSTGVMTMKSIQSTSLL